MKLVPLIPTFITEDISNSFQPGDKFKVITQPDSNLVRIFKSITSAFYDKALQPKAGDTFRVLKNEFGGNDLGIYTIENLNRPNDYIKAMGDDATKAIFAFPKKWADELLKNGKFKKI